MPETRRSVERRLAISRKQLAILEEKLAMYTELEAPVHLIMQRDMEREEIAKLEALLESIELPDVTEDFPTYQRLKAAEGDDASIWQRLEVAEEDASIWQGLKIAVDTGAPPENGVPLEELLEEEESTGRTLVSIMLKLRRPSRLREWLLLALGLIVILGLLGVTFWAYTRLSTQLAPIPWPTPRVEVTQTPVLGFGDLWNEDPGVQSRLGMGVNEEQKVLYLEQHFSENGLMLQFVDPPSPFIYVLYENGQWEVYKGKLAVESQGTPTGEIAVAPSFRPIYEGRKSVRGRLGLPQSHPQEIQGTTQSFEYGQMIWTGADDRHIYTLVVVDGQPDKWALYSDTWVAPGDVVFASNWAGHWQIHTMTSDGSDEVQLTVEPVDVDDFEPVWVPPERKSIAFASTASGLSEIWLIDRNGSNRRQLTTGPGTDGHPSVTWNGELLAFHSDRDGVFQIYLTDLSGTNVRRLTHDSFDSRNPDWAPDGRLLAFDSERGDRRGIYAVDVETGTVELLFNPRDGEIYQQPAWSSDGTRLAFVSRAAGRHVICVANADGSELTKVEGTVGFENVDAPVWSPDGQRLAFTACEGGKASIVVVNVSDGSIVAKISGRGDYKDPDW
jgi:hypothetical protein